MQVEAALARTWRGMQVERDGERERKIARELELASEEGNLEPGIWDCNFCDFAIPMFADTREKKIILRVLFAILRRVYCLKVLIWETAGRF